MTTKKKAGGIDVAAIDAACADMLAQGKIPTVRAVRERGIGGDNHDLCQIVKRFKDAHAGRIEAIKIDGVEGLAPATQRRGSVSLALKYWKERAEFLEKEVSALRRRIDTLEAQVQGEDADFEYVERRD